MTTLTRCVALVVVATLFSFSVFAIEDDYKPYLHTAEVPEHPELSLYSLYKTNLFPGAATYTYSFELPPGRNGLAPQLSVSYNSQAVKQRPDIMGAGWLLSQNMIYRDANSTPTDTSDDTFFLILDNAQHELVLVEGVFHTKIESFMKIEKLSGGQSEYGEYWLVILRDGTRFRFGYNADSELTSSFSYTSKWFLDQVEDTHDNTIFYSYRKNPFPDDSNAVYLNRITYNNEEARKIEFSYENETRPDFRVTFEHASKIIESRRLSDVHVSVHDNLVRRYHFEYKDLNEVASLTGLANITRFGNDNITLLHRVAFDYHGDTTGYTFYNESYVPPLLFTDFNHEDFGVRLADVNNDGFIDFVQGRNATGERSVFLNNKQGNWTNSTFNVPVTLTNFIKVDHGVRFVDVNNDGLVDMLHGYDQDFTKTVYLNNGSEFIENAAWTLPEYFMIHHRDNGVRLLDFNSDGRVDIVRANDGANSSYANNGSGWVQSNWILPARFVSGLQDDATRIVDLNGDGLPDIIQGRGRGTLSKKAWLNNGTQWAEYVNFAPPEYFVTNSKNDTGIRFADVNGDGLVDMLEDFENGTSSRGAWLNTGDGWSSKTAWQGPSPFTKDGQNIGRRLADVNGDGFADIVIAYGNGTQEEKFVYIKNSSSSYLLKEITNEYGGKVDIGYSTSTSFDNSPNGVSDLGFNIWVVSDVVQNNSLTGDFSSLGNYNYTYKFGKYDYQDQEFRGFGVVNETTPGSAVLHYFHQDDAKRGREYKTEVYDDSLLSVHENEFSTTDNGYFTVLLDASTTHLYDSAVSPQTTKTTFTYDQYGNVVARTNHGDGSGNEKYETFSYSVNEDAWIVGAVKEYTLSDDELVSKTNYEYDGLGANAVTKGDLTRTVAWNNEGEDIITEYEYDQYGNLITEINPRGHETRYQYGLRDTTFTFADRVTNALGHRTDFEYDLAHGNFLWQEKNNIRSYFVYDTFGRISKEVQPYDTPDFPTKTYEYVIDGIAPEVIKISQRESSDKYVDNYFYYDGFANLVQLKTKLEDGAVVKNIFYDGLGRVASEQNPYFESFSATIKNPYTNVSKTFYTYDGLDRVVKVTNPDGTEKNVDFNQYTITDFDENGNKHDYLLDAFGRIVHVIEYNRNPTAWNRTEVYNTSYVYDGNDNLVKIVDHFGNEFLFTYDSLSRKTKLVDPDLGTWTYTYDGVGNLAAQNDSKGNVISLGYDALNRITNKNSRDVNITWSYDGQFQGTLTNKTQDSFTRSYLYDDRFRVIKEESLIDGSLVVVGRSYDSMDRIVEQRLPADDLEYNYNKQGKLETIWYYVRNVDYNPFGSITQRQYNNDLWSNFTYTADTNRLNRIVTGSVQDLTYAYDNVGNIKSIVDAPNSKNYAMQYDGLDRLTLTTINNDRYQYEYDAIGNIKRIVRGNMSKRLIYGGPIPHAPSIIIDYEAGAGAYHAADLDSGNKNRTLEFFLVNENSGQLSDVDWNVTIGGNTISSNHSINLTGPVWVLLENSFATGGVHNVNISTSHDTNVFTDTFGVSATSLAVVNQNVTDTLFEFFVESSLSEVATGASWSCSNGVSSSEDFNISGSVMILIQHNYTTSGDMAVECGITSDDGSGNRSTAFEIEDLEVADYRLFDFGPDRKVAVFSLENNYHPLGVNVSIASDNNSGSGVANLSTGANVLVITELAYETDGAKEVNVSVVSGSMVESHMDEFQAEALDISQYNRLEGDSGEVLYFIVENMWPDNLSVRINVSDPYVTNETFLVQNQSVLVFIEEEYADGMKEPVLKAENHKFNNSVQDEFEVKTVKITEMQVLKESSSSTITELNVSNNGNVIASWNLNTGTESISSNTTFNVSTIVLIENSYGGLDGVYVTNASVNASSYEHWTGSVVIT